jgi:hypothetical protein
VEVNAMVDNATVALPVVLPEAAFALPLMFVPFVAFCVMVGLQWSIKSKGTIGSVIAAVGIVFAIVSVVSLCGFASGRGLSVVGGVLNTFSPINLLLRPSIEIGSIGRSNGWGTVMCSGVSAIRKWWLRGVR